MTMELSTSETSSGSERPRLTREEARKLIADLKEMARNAQSDAEARLIISKIAQIVRYYRVSNGLGASKDPISLAQEINQDYQARPHLELLSSRILRAVQDVEKGKNRQLAVSMPPRAGKSTMTSLYAPLWILQRHPEWKTVMTSYDGSLTTGWAREIRHMIEDKPDLGIALKRDGGAGGRWQTVEGGGMYTVGVGGALTGRGARVMIIDDPVADFVAAHSPKIRQNLWNWWLSVAQTRLEPPYLVIVTMTRWHEDDFVGRLTSKEHEGDPEDWEKIVLPAIADTPDDALGRAEGEPLFSPLLVETREQAITRWGNLKEAVGTYTFSAMYQQRPAPQAGAIFNMGWWRFWTRDPNHVSEDGKVVLLDPGTLSDAKWLDSWDMTFKGAEGKGDYVVGQRWAKRGANRYLIQQSRDRRSFTQTIAEMEKWAGLTEEHRNATTCPWFVHTRLVEGTANGPAIMDTLHDKIPGLKSINPKTSKEGRARAITPECESGNVYLPDPRDPGNEWVKDLLSELRNFPYDAHDDQVDAMTQALAELRDPGIGGMTVPGSKPGGLNLERIPSRIDGARSMQPRLGGPRRGF